jgi:hypothetical protein
MLQRNYARHISDYSAEVLSAAQLDLAPSPTANVVPIGRR